MGESQRGKLALLKVNSESKKDKQFKESCLVVKWDTCCMYLQAGWLEYLQVHLLHISTHCGGQGASCRILTFSCTQHGWRVFQIFDATFNFNMLGMGRDIILQDETCRQISQQSVATHNQPVISQNLSKTVPHHIVPANGHVESEFT